MLQHKYLKSLKHLQITLKLPVRIVILYTHYAKLKYRIQSYCLFCRCILATESIFMSAFSSHCHAILESMKSMVCRRENHWKTVWSTSDGSFSYKVVNRCVCLIEC